VAGQAVPVPAVLAPLAAALCYGVAAIVQQVGAQRAAALPPAAAPPAPRSVEWPPTARRLGPALVMGLLRQPLFLLGLGLDTLGFSLAFVGLRSLPVFVVEAAVASTVAVTALLGSRYLADRLSRRDWALVGAVMAGLALVGASAGAGDPPVVGGPGRVLLIAGVPGVVLAAVAFDRRRPATRSRAGDPAPAGRHSAALGAVSGLAFGAFALAGRMLPARHGLAAHLAEPLLWVAVAYAAAGLAIYGAALQRGSVTAVTAAAIATESLFPSAVGLLFLSDHTRPGLAGAAVAGFTLTVAAALALAVRRPDSPAPGVRPATAA